MSKAKFSPLLWGSLILIVSQALTFFIAFREKDFLEQNQISSPQVSLEVILIYFVSMVAVVGIVLFLIPISKLRLVLRVLFTLLFAWGAFIVLGLSLPVLVAAVIAIVGGLVWVLKPKVWLQNLLMVLALAGAGSVFGFLVSPWTFMIFMLVISVYDVLAVRFGYMLWLSKKLSESDTLPAFIIPKKILDWNLNLKETGVKRLFEDEGEREFSMLGGGDVGFPLMLAVSVFLAYGFIPSLIVAVFSLLGLISAYLIQIYFLKGKPMPALPPVSFASLIGLLIVRLLLA